MDLDITLLKELIAEREKIDEQISALISGKGKERKPQTCGTCGKVGHSTRTCPDKPTE